MELQETVEMMNSEDYKERFKAEYYQLSIRFNKLVEMVDKWYLKELQFTPNCPRSTYTLQLKAMSEYMALLEARAVMEGIELEAI